MAIDGDGVGPSGAATPRSPDSSMPPFIFAQTEAHHLNEDALFLEGAGKPSLAGSYLPAEETHRWRDAAPRARAIGACLTLVLWGGGVLIGRLRHARHQNGSPGSSLVSPSLMSRPGVSPSS